MQENKKDKNEVRRMAILLFSRITSWIAFPVIFGVFVGKYLDQRYGTGNFWLLTVVGFSFLISMVAIIKETNKGYKKILEKSNNGKTNKN